MNKDFMLLNDNTIEVTNENGVEINRGEFPNNNVKGILLAENKIEITEIFKRGFSKMLEENKKVVWLSKSMLKVQPVVLVALPVLTFLFGAMSNPNTWLISGISNATSGLAGLIIPVAISTIYWCIIRTLYKKKTKEIEALFKKAEDIKEKSEEKLIKEKAKILTETLQPLVKVSLEEQTNAIKTQVAGELIEYYDENIKQRGKIRTRKR